MNVLVFCVVFLSLVAGFNSIKDYYFVIAPNVIRFHHNETVTVSIFGTQSNVRVTVWLEHRGKHISEKNVTVPNEQHPVQTTVGVKEEDIFDMADLKPRAIKLCSKRESEDEICRNLVLSYRTGYIIVQTDKPIYTPNQKVKIRALPLDESLKVLKDGKTQLAFDIVSPSNLTLDRKTFTSKENKAFYSHTFRLPPHPEKGIWAARAFYKGQFETVSKSLFRVEEYVLPTFGVTVYVSVPYILQNTNGTKSCFITVKAEYVYGRKVEGTARLRLNLTNGMGDNRYLFDKARKTLENGEQKFSLNIREINLALGNRTFPDGYRLLVVATVFETATGKEESAIHEDTIFASKPYKFKFTKSKKYFRVGMEYFVEVDMLTANDQPAKEKNITIQRLDLEETKNVTTNSQGHAFAIFSVKTQDPLKFKVVSFEGEVESDILEVIAHNDIQNQIQVEYSFANDNTMLMRAFVSNVKPEYTGMLFMIISRGKVEHVVFRQISHRVSEPIGEQVQDLINPSARVLVFYVDSKSDIIVADSIKIELEPKCRGKQLTLNPEIRPYSPGQSGKLTISGNSLTWVGVFGMDKAIFLLENQNILKNSTMFDALKSHDLGCGEGSGKNNGDVFKNAGLTILTNALVENDVNRPTENCGEQKRRKRQLYSDDCYGAAFECCSFAYEYTDILIQTEEMSQMDPEILCYAKARNMAQNEDVSTHCIMAFFLTCQHELESLTSVETYIFSKSLVDRNEYASDLDLLRDSKVRIHKRTDFRESFLFDEERLSVNGNFDMTVNYPDSITEWMIQAIGVSEDKGICISEPVNVRVFREFFIQLDLPYKATRLEMFNVKATVFNYRSGDNDKNKMVNMYIDSVDGICYGEDSGKESPRQTFEIEPGGAHSVRFPMVPTKAGLFSVIVTATVTNFGVPQVDQIEKKLFVVDEGIQETRTLQVCLDPANQTVVCENTPGKIKTQFAAILELKEQISQIDLTLPKDAIPGTGSATAYLQGNIMENVVKVLLGGAEQLFVFPRGCSEQVIASTAPNVYALMYLKQTKQMTDSDEEVGSGHIRFGVSYEKSSYRNDDGSYSCYSCSSGNTWLTAFVAKVFCHAKNVVDDAVDEESDLYPTIVWLNNRTNNQGQFIESNKLYAETMMGQTKVHSPGFTAFVLISLLECNLLRGTIQTTVDSAIRYIENLDENELKANPYDLAICTYALALARSKQAHQFKSWLHSIETKSGDTIYWGPSNKLAANAYAVETTAYALLAMLQFNDLRTSGHIVRWLTTQQNSRGAFQSTQDTNVALQGLTEYNIRTYAPDIDLKVTLLADNWEGQSVTVSSDRFQRTQTVRNLPVEKGTNIMTVKVSGIGSGRMRIDLRYNRPAKDDEVCPFEISAVDISDVVKYPIDTNIGELRGCDVCGHCSKDPPVENLDALITTESSIAESNFGRRKRQAGENNQEDVKCVRFSVRAKGGYEFGMSMIYFNLETDVTVKQEDLDKLVEENKNLDQYEMPSDGNGFIVFYLNTLTSEVNDFVFRLVDNFQGDKNLRYQASLDVFDYYNPDKYCRRYYRTSPDKEMPVDYTCSASQCLCLQSLCSKSVYEEIRTLARQKEKPADKMVLYTCNPTKADYAMVVQVKSIYNNSKFTFASATFNSSIHQGSRKHDPDDELTFYWSTRCSRPKFTVGKQYYIIAKDGHDVEKNDNEKEYRYSLMDTALVIVKPSRRGLLRNVMNNYAKKMKDGCRQ